MAQGGIGPEFKPQYHQKKKKKYLSRLPECFLWSGRTKVGKGMVKWKQLGSGGWNLGVSLGCVIS
jgi:hypothetical protein